MLDIFRYGPPKKFVAASVKIFWPVIALGKILSSYPLFRKIINPFFAYPYNEVISIPIGVEVPGPANVALPRRLVERLIAQTDHLYLFDTCICRNKKQCRNKPIDIGCMALGSAVKRVHPSHGRMVSKEEAIAHVRRAEAAGLVANVAHVWIDPLAFGLNFNKLNFICFCDDCCCLYRRHLKHRGENLDRAMLRLPGIQVLVNPDKCQGCGTCKEVCFVDAPVLGGGKSFITDACKGCGRCIPACPNGAIELKLDDEDALFERLMARVDAVCDIRR